MDPQRVGAGERIAAASAVLLVILMFFAWFGGESGWQFKRIDVLLFLIAALAVATALAEALGRHPLSPRAKRLSLTVGGALALGVMITLVVESTGGTVPLVLALLAAAGILYGGLLDPGT